MIGSYRTLTETDTVDLGSSGIENALGAANGITLFNVDGIGAGRGCEEFDDDKAG